MKTRIDPISVFAIAVVVMLVGGSINNHYSKDEKAQIEQCQKSDTAENCIKAVDTTKV